jgi:lipoate-protein ligase B
MDVRDLGIAGYEDVLYLQEKLVRGRIEGKIPDTLIIVEHQPVVTLGRVAKKESVIDRSFFDARSIPVIETSRGGKITYHAPGQIVLYPIIDLREKKKDVTFYIDFLEKVAVKSLARFGVPAARDEKRRGVWARGKKIAFIGVAFKRWIAYHGVSVNINNDLEPFLRMHPCGEPDIRVTSAKEILKRELDLAEVKKVVAEQFARELELLGTVHIN